MEEVVGKLTAWVSSGPNWPYALVHLHEGTHHAPLPKEGHLGILHQRGAEVTPCWGVSQLEVHQLLVSSPHVAYPIGLNGGKEPIVTSLLESLANGISLTGGKSIYLEIDIPQSPAYELDQKVTPIGEFSSIVMDSMSLEVGNLLSQWCWMCQVLALRSWLWEGQTQWSSLHLHLTSPRNSSSWWIPHPRQAPKRRLRWQRHL